MLTENQPKDDGTNPLKRPLTIVFCLPGETFSHHFLKSWSELLMYCITHQIRPIISSHQSSNVHFVRNIDYLKFFLQNELFKYFGYIWNIVLISENYCIIL